MVFPRPESVTKLLMPNGIVVPAVLMFGGAAACESRHIVRLLVVAYWRVRPCLMLALREQGYSAASRWVPNRVIKFTHHTHLCDKPTLLAHSESVLLQKDKRPNRIYINNENGVAQWKYRVITWFLLAGIEAIEKQEIVWSKTY